MDNNSKFEFDDKWWEKEKNGYGGNNKGQRNNNTWLYHLPKRRKLSEVNNPISLGIEPVSLLLANTFDDKMWKIL